MVRVRQKPNFSDLNLIASECGGATGIITALGNSGVSYSLDSLSWQASPNGAYSFQNLSAGNYTIFVTDTSGCIGDSSVFLDETLTVNAAFSASPSSGAVPLEVSITNQSSNYSNLEWFINGVSQGNSLTDYTINQSSTAEITLIAWQNDPSCADTAQVSILAFDSLIISIPNVITANGDGVNDEFSVQSNLPISIEYTITNRWGNVLQSGALQTQSGPLILWNPATDISEGTYFYQLKFSSSVGNIDQQLETWGRLKQGNIELVR
jgi:PKD repeat protein